jgi:uncharacterized protein YpmS
MSTKPNYFKLGLFILLALFMLVVAIIMFGLFCRSCDRAGSGFSGSGAGCSNWCW